MPNITNITERRRGINTSTGYVEFAPGETKNVDVSEADMKANKGLFSGKATDKPIEDTGEAEGGLDHVPTPLESDDAYDAMSDDALRDMIEEATGERPHPRTGRDRLLQRARESEKKAG